MTPGVHDIVIYRGAKFEETLAFKTSGTTTAIDLTGFSPFRAQVTRGKTVVANFTVADTDLAAGQITLALSSAVTAPLSETDDTRWGVLDSLDNLYVIGTASIRAMPPRPS